MNSRESFQRVLTECGVLVISKTEFNLFVYFPSCNIFICCNGLGVL
jgi:hypothetical protein